MSLGHIKTVNGFRLLKHASRLSVRDQAKVLWALLLLAYLNVAVKLMPFAKVIRFGSVPVGPTPKDSKRVVEESVRAVKRASYASPWRTVCIHEGLALQRMVRRKGVPAVLCYGTAHPRGELKSHVWVSIGNDILIGGEAAPDFQLLATYPAPQ